MHSLEFDKSDWTAIEPKNRNSWQHVAAYTHGYVTIGNFVTLLGLTFSLIGMKAIYDNNLVLGIYLLAIGRVADVLDGYVARLTKTKGRTGEILDAGSDKLLGVVALVSFAIKNTVPIVPLVLIFLRSVTNVGFTFVAKKRAKETHTSIQGKYAEFTEWTMLLSYIISKLANEHGMSDVSTTFSIVGYLLLAIFIVLATYSTIGYGRIALRRGSSKTYHESK